MAKQLLYSEQARACILKGVNQLADAVKATLDMFHLKLQNRARLR